MKKAFTLVELLVVIGILGILMGILVVSMGGGTESARAAKCLTNMKNLVTACNNRGMTVGSYPAAGSFESRSLDTSGNEDVSFCFYENHGWISWDSQGAYAVNPKSHVASGAWITSSYNTDLLAREYALTNGAIWKYLSGNTQAYLCPVHTKMFKIQNPLWSYVMNSRFGWDYSMGSRAVKGGIQYGRLSRADRTLMFSELQFAQNDKVEVSTDSSSGIRNDCTLQYERDEIIGFNHPDGKRGLCAHLAFADGHVEKLRIPAVYGVDGWTIEMSVSDLKDLTKWLCQGKDIAYDPAGKKYKKLVD